jgi:uncharacterized membrane protein (GlpM family)
MTEIVDVFFKALLGGLVIAAIAVINDKAGAKAAAILSFIPVFTFLGILFVGQEALASGEVVDKVIKQYLHGLFYATPIMIIFLLAVYFLIKHCSLLISVIISLLIWLSLSIVLIISI